MKIPVNEPKLWGNEKKYVNDCLDSNWFSSSGKYLEEFEQKFARYCNKKHAIAVNNGTSALEIACHALDLRSGDEVIIPSFCIISLAVAIIRQGGVPVPVDIEPDTWNIDPSKIQEAITSRTKALIVVDTYGHPADYDSIIPIAKKNNLIIIEDAAESHGAMYKGKICGSIGHISTFSFYGNKLITTGEGGMVLTDDEKLYVKMKSFKNLHFLDKNEKRFHHDNLGFNYRMTNIQAAIGLGQLEHIDQIVKLKRDLGFYYIDKLKNIPGLKTQTEKYGCRTVFWMYGFQMHDSISKTAKDVIHGLNERGIGTRPFFKGMHLQPALKNKIRIIGNYPITEAARKFGLYLPSGMTLDYKKIDHVIKSLKEVLACQ